MPDTTAIKLGIYGSFPNEGMVDWIVHRAQVLDLTGFVQPPQNDTIEVMVVGEPVLVDAFEVACSLGPINALVLSISRQPVAVPSPDCRHRTQFIRY